MTLPVNEAPLLFAGMTTLDVVQLYRERPAWGTKGVATDAYTDVGGPAANAAVTASLLGGRARLATVIGEGVVGNAIRSRLQELGVQAQDLAAAGAQAPVSSIWVDQRDGGRTVLSTNRAEVGGAAAAAAVEDGCAAVLVDGHYPEICMAVVERAAEQGIPVVLDGGSWKPVLERVLPQVAVAILSSDFALPGSASPDPWVQARELAGRFGVREVAVTRGAEAVFSLAAGVEERIAVPRVEAVDTLGAGDVFHGAYMYFRYVARQPHAEALRRAARVASESCAHIGARAGVRRIAQALS